MGKAQEKINRLKTGFEAVVKRSGTAPMPHFESFSVNSPEKMAAFEFDDPGDQRRFYSAGDDQLNGVGDALNRNTPALLSILSLFVVQ